MDKILFRFTGFLVFLGCSLGVVSSLLYNIGELQYKIQAEGYCKDKTGLKTLTLSIIKFNSYSNKQEINVNGALYDVAGYTQVGDSVVVTVWHDEGEETLDNEIIALQEYHQLGGQGTAQHFAKYHTYLPDVKVLPSHWHSLSITFKPLQPNSYFLQGGTTLFKLPMADVICPPPDLIS